MDAPPIQYARTKDGANIAYWSIGEGPPLFYAPNLLASHVQAEWQSPTLSAAYERLATRCTLVRYDCRGTGLSRHEKVDLSVVETAILDLEAVAERLRLSRFAIYSSEWAGDSPFAFAARCPERLTHLAHWARSRYRQLDPQLAKHFAAIQPLMDTEWDLYVDISTRLMLGWDSAGASSLASGMRASHTPESLRQARSRLNNPSRETYLSEIKVPTLVLYPTAEGMSQQIAVSLAAGIQAARLLGVPGESHGSTVPNEAGISAILDFVNTKPPVPNAPIAAPELDTSVFRAVVWTDLEAHTPIMQRLGDAKGREVLREHERVTREALREYGGTEVKAMGDGFMASFPSVQKALECAISLQETFASREIAGERLRCRIGINAGEPIQEAGDLFGTAVITAARIAALAKGGEVLVSDVVRQLVAGKGFSFEDRGEQPLKGISEPVRIWAARQGS